MNTADPNLLAELYARHRGWLYNRLYRKLGCPGDAADLTQDTFLRILCKPPREGLCEPRAFLTRVAHGLMANHLRRRDVERAYLDALAHLPPACIPDPEQRAQAIEALLAIDAMLDGLSARARQAFLMSQLEGLRYAEIAARLGVSTSMVKKYMLQAVGHCLRIAERCAPQ